MSIKPKNDGWLVTYQRFVSYAGRIWRGKISAFIILVLLFIYIAREIDSEGNRSYLRDFTKKIRKFVKLRRHAIFSYIRARNRLWGNRKSPSGFHEKNQKKTCKNRMSCNIFNMRARNRLWGAHLSKIQEYTQGNIHSQFCT